LRRFTEPILPAMARFAIVDRQRADAAAQRFDLPALTQAGGHPSNAVLCGALVPCEAVLAPFRFRGRVLGGLARIVGAQNCTARVPGGTSLV